jgi:NADPH2:quinone reductase
MGASGAQSGGFEPVHELAGGTGRDPQRPSDVLYPAGRRPHDHPQYLDPSQPQVEVALQSPVQGVPEVDLDPDQVVEQRAEVDRVLHTQDCIRGIIFHGIMLCVTVTDNKEATMSNTMAIPATMRAVVLDGPGPPEALTIRKLPVPVPGPGRVLIWVTAFGLNRSELHTRLGLAHGVTFPRVPGIEATGVVAACPGGEFTPGQQVMAMMGGMGRTYDGGYAEYTCVPAGQVVAFDSELDAATLGAIPEMLQTAHGSLSVGLDVQPGQTLLIRGGTSSVGLATAVLAKRRGLTVLATTRDLARADVLRRVGVDHVILDDGAVAARVRAIVPDGVDGALELVGTPTLPDTLATTRVHGVVCFTGMLSNQWIVPEFYPIDYLPRGVRLTAYSGDASDLPPEVLQGFLDDVAAGRAIVPLARTYRLDEIVKAHTLMEDGSAGGKLVVIP